MGRAIRILVVGAGGFVGRHLVAALAAEHGADAVVSAGRDGAPVPLDLTDDAQVRSVLDAVRPSHVVNLAGLAAPEEARAHETRAWALHVHAPVGLGRALAARVPDAWLLHVGSGLAYGRTALHGRPISETEALEPLDPYGLTKAAGDMALGTLAAEGVRVVRLRPFNHTGPGQSQAFAVPAFARQIARIEAGLSPPTLSVGNLDAARDFLHVADVVSAYAAVLRATDALTSGEALNVASGVAVPMREVVGRLLALSCRRIEICPDPTRARESDLPTIAGDAAALRARTGWRPLAGLDRALDEVLAFERAAADRG